MPATVRVTILMKPEEKHALRARARRDKVSLGELVRGALFAKRREEDAALLAAVDALRASNEAARKALDHTLRTIAERDRNACARAEAVRAETRERISGWPPEQAARLRELFVGNPGARR